MAHQRAHPHLARSGPMPGRHHAGERDPSHGHAHGKARSVQVSHVRTRRGAVGLFSGTGGIMLFCE